MNEEIDKELMSMIEESHYWSLVDDVAQMIVDKKGHNFTDDVITRVQQILKQRDKEL
jgi:PleD family two-component response regulator